MEEYEKYFETNQKLWDSKTPIHLSSDFYNMDGFVKGGSSLRKIELSELPDVNGKSILHTQCHFGQDTLSLERMGGNCTGIDFSPVAISTASKIRDEIGLKSRFIRCNMYEVDKHLNEDFDLVYTSYGVIAWLPNLHLWAEQISKRLKPGGLFYMAEFHPVLYMFDWGKNEIAYDYFNQEKPHMETLKGTYAVPEAGIEMKEYFWQHSLSEVFQSLLNNDLEIIQFNEYDYSPYDCFDNLVKRKDQEYVFRHSDTNLPHVFTLMCRKKNK